jgi:hypothetical protein
VNCTGQPQRQDAGESLSRELFEALMYESLDKLSAKPAPQRIRSRSRPSQDIYSDVSHLLRMAIPRLEQVDMEKEFTGMEVKECGVGNDDLRDGSEK